MNIYIIIGLTVVITGGVLFIVWNYFFNWYEEKRMREARILLDSINNKTWEDRQQC